MTDRTEPPISLSTEPKEPDGPKYEPKTKPMVLWGLGGLAVMVLVVGVFYDVGNRTRTTGPAGSAASSGVAPGALRP